MLVGVATVRLINPNWRVGDVAHRLIKVGVVEYVERLGVDLDLGAFPFGESKVLHQGQIGVEIPRAIHLVAPLISERERATWRKRSRELRRVHARSGGHEVVEHRRTATGDWPDVAVSEQEIPAVEAVQRTGICAVDNGKGKSSSVEERAGDGPVGYQVEEEVVELRCVPDISRVELMARIVVGIAVVGAPEAVGILRVQNTGVRAEVKGQEAAVGNIVERMAPGKRSLQLEGV